ncbi:MAG TPA: ATP-binding protein [Edaphobacter sp.]|nr:ATP-binding protein [Edaphobacter sp.]
MRRSAGYTSIASKLTRMSVLVGATALLLAFVSFLALYIMSSRQELLRSLHTQAQILGANTSSALLFDDAASAESTLEALSNSPNIEAATLAKADGEVLATYRRPGAAPPPKVRPWSEDASSHTWTRRQKVVLAHKIIFNGRMVGIIVIRGEMTAVWQHVALYSLISAGIMVFCLLLSVALTSRLRQLLAAPVTRLSEAARAVSLKKDYSIRVPREDRQDEFSDLIDAFNEMLQQIEERDQAVREARNILEERVAERTAELQEANQELEAFAYSVAHDLRNPLEGLTNAAYLLESAPAEQLNGDAREMAGLVGVTVKRLTNVVTDLLDLSRARNVAIHREPVDLSVMAEKIETELRATEPGRHVEFAIEPGLKVIADSGLMYIVLYNLICNAWKYSSRVEKAKIEVTAVRMNGQRAICVSDNGAGFDPQFAGRLFRPFQRLHTQEEFSGTGIGLATVERIIHRHGGSIRASSKPGEGAQFCFVIPDQ